MSLSNSRRREASSRTNHRNVLFMQVIAEKSLTRYRLQQIINTREQDLLEPSQPQAIAELEAYAEGTATQLLFLQVRSAYCMPISFV